MTYNSYVTNAGIKKIEAAYAADTTVKLVGMAVGDSGGAYVEPSADVTELVSEFARVDIVDSATEGHMIHVIAVVPSTDETAGKVVREYGIYDEDDTLIIYGAYPDSLVPDLASSEYLQLEIESIVELENAESVVVTVNPLYPHATETEAGIAKIATTALVDEGADDSAFLTVKKFFYALDLQSVADKLWLNLSSRICPVGTPLPWLTNEVPDGFAVMKDQAFDLVACPRLAAVWPDGIIPSMQGDGLIGAGDGEAVGAHEDGQVMGHGHDATATSVFNGVTMDTHAHAQQVNSYDGHTDSSHGNHVVGSNNEDTQQTALNTAAVSAGTPAGSVTTTVSITTSGATKNTINHRKCHWIVRLA